MDQKSTPPPTPSCAMDQKDTPPPASAPSSAIDTKVDYTDMNMSRCFAKLDGIGVVEVKHSSDGKVVSITRTFRVPYYLSTNEGVITETYHPNGKLASQTYTIGGRRYGYARKWHQNGALCDVACYRKGELHGWQTVYYRNGAVKRFTGWRRDMREGPDISYDKRGNSYMITYDDDVADGDEEEWIGDRLVYSVRNVDGVRDGVETDRRVPGVVIESDCADGKWHGDQKIWHHDRLASHVAYEHGKMTTEVVHVEPGAHDVVCVSAHNQNHLMFCCDGNMFCERIIDDGVVTCLLQWTIATLDGKRVRVPHGLHITKGSTMFYHVGKLISFADWLKRLARTSALVTELIGASKPKVGNLIAGYADVPV